MNEDGRRIIELVEMFEKASPELLDYAGKLLCVFSGEMKEKKLSEITQYLYDTKQITKEQYETYYRTSLEYELSKNGVGEQG